MLAADVDFASLGMGTAESTFLGLRDITLAAKANDGAGRDAQAHVCASARALGQADAHGRAHDPADHRCAVDDRSADGHAGDRCAGGFESLGW